MPEQKLSFRSLAGLLTGTISAPACALHADRSSSKDPPAERVAFSLPLKGDENASCPRFYLKQALLFTFRLPFFCFWIFHLTADLISIQTDSINTVTTRPKMITPIRFLLQFTKLIEYTNLYFTLTK